MSEKTEGGDSEPTTPRGRPTTRWLLWKLQRGDMTAEEFVKLSKQHGDELSKTPFDTSGKTGLVIPKGSRWTT